MHHMVEPTTRHSTTMADQLRRTKPETMPSQRHSEPPPTKDEIKKFKEDLVEIREHFSKLYAYLKNTDEDADTRSETEMEAAVRDTDLKAVEVKLRQVNNIRKFIRSDDQIANPDYQDFDPLLERVGETLSRFIREMNHYRQRRLQQPRRLDEPLRSETTRSRGTEVGRYSSAGRRPYTSLLRRGEIESKSTLGLLGLGLLGQRRSYGTDDKSQALKSDEPARRHALHRLRAAGDDDTNSLAVESQQCSLGVWIDRTKIDDGETKWQINRNSQRFLEDVAKNYTSLGEAAVDILRRSLRIEFDGEEGYDSNGLTREFFSLALEGVITRSYKDRRLLVGERGRLLPNQYNEYMVEGYRFLGLLIGHAVLNNCRGLAGFSPLVQHYILHVYGQGVAFIDESQPPISIDDVDDKSLQRVLVKLDANDYETLSEAENTTLNDALSRFNCAFKVGRETCHAIVQDILVNYVIMQRIRLLDAIAGGMEELGLVTFLRQNNSPEIMSIVFPSPDDKEISPDEFLRVTDFGNEYNRTDRAIKFFKRFLSDLHDGVIKNEGRTKTISNLVQLMSGSPYLPHLPPKLKVLSSDWDRTTPFFPACAGCVLLPAKCLVYEEFRDSMASVMMHDMAFDCK